MHLGSSCEACVSAHFDDIAMVSALQVGEFDPITRVALRSDQVVPNIALRSATLHYLEEHPWAWLECY